MSPDELDARISAARRSLNSGQVDAAAAIAADLLRAASDNLDALEIKALAEIEKSEYGAAEQTLRSAIAVAPQRRWPYADLTRLLLRAGRHDEAETVAHSALVADPDNADAHAMLGSMLAKRGMLEPAAAHLERAVALAGRHPQLLADLGRMLMRLDRRGSARALLAEAAVADPAALEPHVYLAELEEREGNFDAAMQHLDRAEPIAAAAGTDVTLQRSVLLERMGKIDEAHALLDEVARPSGATLLQRGRLRDRLGRHSEAWNDWTAGKTLLATQAGRSYPAQEVRHRADVLAGFFDRERSAGLPRAASKREVPQPIFILGFPRSGTTLIEQILASHSAIRAGGELPFCGDLVDFSASLVGGEGNFPAGLLRLAEEESHWPELLRDFYLAKAADRRLAAEGVDYFTDKMPLNEMWLPLLQIAFPRSPFVLVRRHPLDVLTSVMAHDMTHGFNCAYRLEDAARHLALMDELLVRFHEAGFGITHELRYETLVADQRGETERLMAAIGLPFEARQLRFHERQSVSPTPSYAQVQEPLNERSIGRWRAYERELESVRPLLATAIARSGYSS